MIFNMRPRRTTAVGIVRDTVSLAGKLTSLSFKAIGTGLALAHNGLDSLAHVSKSVVDNTKEGYSTTRSKNESKQMEFDF